MLVLSHFEMFRQETTTTVIMDVAWASFKGLIS
jgi:hypothetical protein